MTLTTVILKSDDIVPVLINGVIVRIFSTLGVFVTSATTNGSGEVIVDLPDADYDLLFFKSGVSILAGMPLRITVSASDTDTPPNTFLVLAHITALPESPDPLLCRISGSIRGSDGNNTKDIRLSLGMCPEIAVLSGIVIAPQEIIDVRPDDTGYYEFNLLRSTKYRVYFPQLVTLFNVEPAMVLGITPDLPALPLTDFLLPVPISAIFGTLTLSILLTSEPDSSVSCTITYSDGSINDDGLRPVPPFFTSVQAISDDGNIALAVFSVDKLIISPKGIGTCNVTVTRQISTTLIVYDPVPTFTTQTLVVTVS